MLLQCNNIVISYYGWSEKVKYNCNWTCAMQETLLTFLSQVFIIVLCVVLTTELIEILLFARQTSS